MSSSDSGLARSPWWIPAVWPDQQPALCVLQLSSSHALAINEPKTP